MAELVTIVMEPRPTSGRGELNKLRGEGFVPCVFYGPELAEPVAGKVKATVISRLLNTGHWETMRLSLKLPSGSEEMCIIREIQRHPLTGKLVHVDFMRLLKGRKITVDVPVRIQGKEVCPGIKDGGVLENIHEIEIETLPMSMPESIEVDISGLALGEMIYVKDLKLPGDVTVLADPEEVVAIVAAPKVVEDLPSEGEKEVEVVAKGKAAKTEG